MCCCLTGEENPRQEIFGNATALTEESNESIWLCRSTLSSADEVANYRSQVEISVICTTLILLTNFRVAGEFRLGESHQARRAGTYEPSVKADTCT